MDSIISILLLIFAFCSVTAQRNISLGSSLTPTGNSTWLSPSGLFAYGFYRLGDRYGVGIHVAGVPQKTVVWTANRDQNPTFPANASLILSMDGRILVRQLAESDSIIYAGTGMNQSIAYASMLDSGNFILYNAQANIIWQSFDNPTDTLLPRQTLKPDQRLISSVSETDYAEGSFFIIMQIDGNLVMYPMISVSPSTAYYATMTFGNHTLNLRDDGHLYLMNSSSYIIRNISNGGFSHDRKLNLLKMDFDGIVKLYSYSLDGGNQTIIWQSTNDKCAPLGRCGFNSYCTAMDDKMECKCLPGFEFLIPGNWSLGCERNFTVHSCKLETSNIVQLQGVVWENNPFLEMENETSEDCQKACLDDCNCEVAFWKDGFCRMQRLPMRFGRRVSEYNLVLSKVGNEIPDSLPNTPPSVSVEKKVRFDILIVGICLSVIGVIMFFLASGICYGKRYKKIGTFDRQNGEFLDGIAPRAFSFEELKEATDDFSHEVGRGGFGTVYKGVLKDFDKIVAVKKLENVVNQGNKEFQNEIRAIGKTHHRNLVRFLGYCLDGTKRLLVYDYMSNGSLADVLYNKDGDHQIPDWDERYRIARDVARGILYLHQECDTQIIHCDIKPENILLDESRCAKISDFGLAKLLDPDQTRIFTGIRGTKGYVAPEWHRKSAVTVKADVFSFGIVLLEIICCRKSVDFTLPDDEAILEDFSYECFRNGKLDALVPACEHQQVAMSKFERLVKIGLWCIQYDPSFRPSMNKVLLMLEGTVDIPVPPCPGETFLSAN